MPIPNAFVSIAKVSGVVFVLYEAGLLLKKPSWHGQEEVVRAAQQKVEILPQR
jgi:hypothetical protein